MASGFQLYEQTNTEDNSYAINTQEKTEPARYNGKIPSCYIVTRTTIYTQDTIHIRPRKESRWAGHVARMGVERGVYMVMVGKPEGR